MPLVLPEKKTSLGLDLAKLLSPEQVKWDWATLKAYSVDASIYKGRSRIQSHAFCKKYVRRIFDWYTMFCMKQQYLVEI